MGSAKTDLFGQPGSDQLSPPWLSLRRAADSLAAACGELKLAAFEDDGDPAVRQAWRDGASRELNAACVALRQAARDLGEAASGCDA